MSQSRISDGSCVAVDFDGVSPPWLPQVQCSGQPSGVLVNLNTETLLPTVKPKPLNPENPETLNSKP